LVNTATISQDGNPDPITASATDTDVLNAAPDLTLTKTDGLTESPGVERLGTALAMEMRETRMRQG
jgi:hypothetical protein